MSARVKDAPGLAEKVATGRPAHTIGDYLGGRIAVENPAALKSAINEIEKKYRILDSDNKIANPTKGYRAVHMQVDLGNGMSAEIQLYPAKLPRSWIQRTGSMININASTKVRCPVSRILHTNLI